MLCGVSTDRLHFTRNERESPVAIKDLDTKSFDLACWLRAPDKICLKKLSRVKSGDRKLDGDSKPVRVR